MKVTRTRGHTINMGNYESFRTEATIETEISDDYLKDEYPSYLVAHNLDDVLDGILAADLEEAAKLTTYAESYGIMWKKPVTG